MDTTISKPLDLSEAWSGLSPITRETVKWVGAGALCAVGAAVTNREIFPRAAKAIALVGVLRAGHAASEYINAPKEGPSPSLGQMLVSRAFVDIARQGVDHLVAAATLAAEGLMTFDAVVGETIQD